MNLNHAYQVIQYYCHLHGIEIVRSRQWQYDAEAKTIHEVWRGKPTQTWLFSMLHELGHSILSSKMQSQPVRYREHPSEAKNAIEAVNILKEELDAWNIGYQLSQRLNLNVDQSAYEHYAAPFIRRYMSVLS